ncbi:hypothetical protein CYMTET_32180 [Cymbomonas tetramitiformis]|uniref:EGF-like domain-containing protein n=1 Tax=Cymbomonas tetramitiformis TaxID=36881 RepID=A0AAE0FFB7_9CHLO|nr:hypothetical protein CYMTET_32180 [Cymbomonas tetramitiformis]
MKANFFMGPSMYETVQLEGKNAVMVDQMGRPCDEPEASETCFFTHSDMLHSAPLCMGIGHDPEAASPFGNVYWLFDGLNGTLMRFDFEKPHYPGSLDHQMANVRRYEEIRLTRVPGVVSHIVVDASPHTVYIADTGANRVIALDAASGRFDEHARNDLGGNYTIWSSEQATFEYSVYTCARFKNLTTAITHPSGLALHGNVLFVASYSTGEISALNKVTGELIQLLQTSAQGVNGLAVQASTGRLFYADGPSNSVMAVDPTAACSDDQPSVPATLDYAESECPAPRKTTLGVAVAVAHEDGYMNMTSLGEEYGESEDCQTCNENCNNDMILMSGYLCHRCIPEPCKNGGSCTNYLGEGYTCNCPSGFTGDHCQVAYSSPPTSDSTYSPTSSSSSESTSSPTPISFSTSLAYGAIFHAPFLLVLWIVAALLGELL